MHKFRLKQKRTKRLLNFLLIFTAVYIFVFIGAEPYITDSLGSSAVFNYIAQLLIVLSLVFLYVYYSKYGKATQFIEKCDSIISDNGYYLTSRDETDIESYEKAVSDDLTRCAFTVKENVESNELVFNQVAYKHSEYVYTVSLDTADKSDIIAYLDSAVYDLTAVNLKRKGNCAVMFICNETSDEAVKLSKDITSLGRKGQLKVGICIIEVTTKRVYFLGNEPTKLQQMIAAYAMNCEVPIKEKYISKDKLPFQLELESKLDNFNTADYKNGKYDF